MTSKSGDGDALAFGFAKLIGSQVFLRLATFSLNQIVTKLLSVEAFGLMSIRFHLINTMILMIGREGFRRGCLTARQGSQHQLGTKAVLTLGAMSIPLGLLATIPVTYAFSSSQSSIPDYNTAVLLQGLAAIIELVSEPMYILTQARMQIGLRVSIEALSTIIKIVATLLLLASGSVSEPMAISFAQVIFATTILAAYVVHYWPEWVQSRQRSKQSCDEYEPKEDWCQDDFILCSSFTAQAVEKLALAEGSKLAMTWMQSAYEQGIYGLVVNFGSIAARTILQPFEEAAFFAFSRPLDPAKPASQKLDILVPLLKLAILFGGLAITFGPNNTFPVLHLLYGQKYSKGEAPLALAWYCLYMLLLATNGILESFVHATAHGKQLAQGHVALVSINIAQTVVTLPLVAYSSSLGMIFADSIGMVLRILYCTNFILYQYRPNLSQQQDVDSVSKVSGGHTKESQSAMQKRGQPSTQKGSDLASTQQLSHDKTNAGSLRQACPQTYSIACLGIIFVLSAVSYSAFFGRGCLQRLIPRIDMSFSKSLAVHVLVQLVLCAVALGVLLRTERSLVRQLKVFRQKQQ